MDVLAHCLTHRHASPGQGLALELLTEFQPLPLPVKNLEQGQGAILTILGSVLMVRQGDGESLNRAAHCAHATLVVCTSVPQLRTGVWPTNPFDILSISVIVGAEQSNAR